MYLYQQYNVCPYYQNPVSAERNNMSRLMNALATGLNERIRLPKYVILCPDLDPLKTIKFDDNKQHVPYQLCANWLITEVDKFFTTRKENLKDRRLGAVSGDTRFIWVNIVNRPLIKNHPERERSSYLAGRTKFNTALNDLVAVQRFHHAMTVNGLTEMQHFTHLGNLSSYGQEHYWKQIDNVFKKFDRHEINLKPPGQKQKNSQVAQTP